MYGFVQPVARTHIGLERSHGGYRMAAPGRCCAQAVRQGHGGAELCGRGEVCVKVLVLGGGGQVARAVAGSVPKNHTVIVKTHKDLDIADATAVELALTGSEFEWIVNGAAYTAVDLAETEPEQARKINDTAVGVLARTTARAGCRLMHLSTDFVCDGRSNRAYLPTDATQPLSSYGRSKLGGEQHILE